MTNPSKLEQVARALWEVTSYPFPWGQVTPEAKAVYVKFARAAIAAMEVPTEDDIDRAAERYAGDKAEFENFGAVMNAFADGANFVRAALKEEK